MWLRIIRSTVSIALLCSCSNSENPNQRIVESVPDTPLQRTSKGEVNVLYEKLCQSCDWKIAQVPLVDAIPTDTFNFKRSVAIEFFYLATRNDWYDSLEDHHQTYYRSIDQWGRYTTLIRPWLKDRGVLVIEPPKNRSVLFFEDDGGEYIVDIHPYFSTDGVLMFKPGKAPVFWTAEALSKNCDDSTFVECYFGY